MSRNETSIPYSEVVPTAKRRRFTAQEKMRILKEADACTELGEVGALLRREGIYSSPTTLPPVHCSSAAASCWRW